MWSKKILRGRVTGSYIRIMEFPTGGKVRDPLMRLIW